MGINGPWEIINEAGQVVHIAEYAVRHFEQHKRPLRIAVDEACWRFTNLTAEQVQKIREGEPAANPVEKVILWRVLRLMKLSTQLLFIYDGMRKPWKQRQKGGGGKLDKELIKLLHQLFDHLKIPYHQAPGEAEAECAALQRAGIVDAVWSDDGDAFMFGATTLIKQHKVGKNRVKDEIKVFTADRIRDRFDFDADSFMLFAMLSGGDYNTQGLRGCGPQVARRVARREYKVAAAARHVRQDQLANWRSALELTSRLCGKPMEVPGDFPDFKALCNYREPTISTPEQLRDLRGLRQGWDRAIDQRKLRNLLRDRFHFGTREFLKHIAPLYLTRALTRATPDQHAENLQFGVVLKRTRKLKTADGEEAPSKFERKVTYSPLPAVEIDLSVQPPEEDWGQWDGKDGTPYDPTQPIECEVLECFLKHGLPDDSLTTAPTTTRKKRKTVDGVAGEPSPKKTKQQASQDERHDENEAGAARLDPSDIPKKRGRPKKNDAGLSAPNKPRKRKAKSEAAAGLPVSPPPATFQLPKYGLSQSLKQPAFRSSSTVVMDLCDESSDSESGDTAFPFKWPENAIEAKAKDSLFVTPTKASNTMTALAQIPAASKSKTVSVAPPMLTSASASASKSIEASLVPGETIAPATLRELRAAAFWHQTAAPSASMVTEAARPEPAPPRITAREVIDLT